MEKPKAILFDLGDTVLHEVKFDFDAGAEYLYSVVHDIRGVRYEDFYKEMRSLFDDVYLKINRPRFEIPWITFNKILFEYYGFTLKVSYEETELEFWKKAEILIPAPNIFEAIAYIQTCGIPMGIVSNAAPSGKMLEWELSRHGLRGYFEFLMSTSDYGIRKPHPFIFQLAAKKIGAKPEEIWFFGDNVEWDIEGSRSVGMTPFHYIGKIGKSPFGEKDVIKNWNEIKGLLGC